MNGIYAMWPIFHRVKRVLHLDRQAMREACLFLWFCWCVSVRARVFTKKESWRQKWLCYFVVVLVDFTEARTKVTQASKNIQSHSDQI